MSKKKKIVIMSSLVLLLAITAILNVLFATGTFASGDEAVSVANYFTTFRSERTTTRSEEIVQIDQVLALYEKDSDKYNEAVSMKMKIVETMEKELLLETLIKSRGFSDAVVSIGMNSDNVNVFINSNELDYNTAMQIYTMLKDEVGIAPGSIIILPVYSQV